MPADSVHYQIVYDAATAGYTDWWFPASGIAIFAVSAFFVWMNKRVNGGPLRQGVFYAACGFAVLWTAGAFAVTYNGYASLRDALRTGRYRVITGVVSNFQPSDAEGHRMERWNVESGGTIYHYEYSPFVLSPGFRMTARDGGPIGMGVEVRIADVDGNIARLEVAERQIMQQIF